MEASPGYAWRQLLAARERHAPEKVRQWLAVLRGMHDGTLRVGSRVPVAGVPPWVTLDVVHGGFATGQLAAGGPLREFEMRLVREMEGENGEERSMDWSGQGDADRTRLNVRCLAEGWEGMLQMLSTGRFRVRIPEEAALLVLVWLLDKGEQEKASQLIGTISPFFDRLRFFPEPSPAPPPAAADNDSPGDAAAKARAYVCTVKEAVQRLQEVKPSLQIMAMKEAVSVWVPLKDKMVDLFLETVEGDPPHFQRDESGAWLRDPRTLHPVTGGGWPAQHFPEGWRDCAKKLLGEASWPDRQANDEGVGVRADLGGGRGRSKDYKLLLDLLGKSIPEPTKLTGRDVGKLRSVLAAHLEKHGAAGSTKRTAKREMQAQSVAKPLFADVARVVANRLKEHYEDQEEGAPGLEACLGPLSPAEASLLGAPVGFPLPLHIRAKALCCLEAPLHELISSNLVPSAEMMASTLPLLSAEALCSSIEDARLRQVYRAVYKAFRRRRSLLLLNLQSQVRLKELPWVDAVSQWVGQPEEAALEVLTESTRLALETWPQTLMPNKLVKELQALAAAARFQIPLVEELAADIFCGEFAAKFLYSAQIAGKHLQGSLYERYYGLDYGAVLALNDVSRSEYGPPLSAGFMSLCEELAGVTRTRDYWGAPAENGAIIEQAMVLTTHNLAALVFNPALGLRDRLDFDKLARQCFEWVCLTHSRCSADSNWRVRLHVKKNTAYAWRNMVFFLSLGGSGAHTFIPWAEDHFRKKCSRGLEDYLEGLKHAVAGGSFAARGHNGAKGAKFLGWKKN